MEILDRIKLFVNANELSINKLAKNIGMSQVTVNNYMIGKRKLSFELVDAILKRYPEVSAEWLLRGTGNMYKSEEFGGMVSEDIASPSMGEAYYNKLVEEMNEVKSKLNDLQNKVG